MQTRALFLAAFYFLAACFLGMAPAFPKSPDTGKLKVCVCPRQAYVFVDGKAIRDGNQRIKLTPGEHTVGVYNYGYLPRTETVHINAGQQTGLNVALVSSGDKVSGPFAEIEIKGPPRAAVLLTGQTPSYFVGDVDEFNWDWIWHQRLLVKPGTYTVTVTRFGNTVWSGPVTAKAGQHVTVYVSRNGQTKTQAWKEGLTMGPQPRFDVGMASATIPVAPVTAQMSAQGQNLVCGQSATLNWNSADAVDTSISGIGGVGAEGNRSVTPNRTMTYELTAKGPGGEVTRSVTIDENTQPTANLTLSQPEIRYRKVGDKVMEQDTATLNWSASNASSASLTPFGNAPLDGSRTITANPEQTGRGPINQEITYTFTVSNVCGGTETKTATLHLVGSIEAPPPLSLSSLFYPTAYPTEKHPDIGLVDSEKEVLSGLAKSFKDYEQYDHQAQLQVVGHADVRGSSPYNQSLSERRADLVRDFLVSMGIPADKIQTSAVGKDEQLDQDQVAALQSQDPKKPENWEEQDLKTTWLAYNRRVDLVLQPQGEKSRTVYPNDVANVRIIWQRHAPSLKTVQGASASVGAQTSASNVR